MGWASVLPWLVVLQHSSSASNTPPDFELVTTIHVPAPAGPEQRGFHFVTPPIDGTAYGCGILGELCSFDLSNASRASLTTSNFSSALAQARSLLLLPSGLLAVGATEFQFYDVSEGSPRLVKTVRPPTHNRTGDGAGLNGMVLLPGGMLVAAAMGGALVTTNAGSPGGMLELAGSLKSSYDLAVLQSGRSTYLVVVSAKQPDNLLALVLVTDSDGQVLPPADWKVVGVVGSTWRGCNRVRVVGHVAYVSCIHSNNVAAVDISNPALPAIIWETTFDDEQPTGMLLQGNALLVAGGRTVVVYNVTNPLNPTHLTSCVGPCSQILQSHGQNAHSLAAYREPNGSVLLLLTAQIDNNVGLVRIASPKVCEVMYPTKW